MLLMLIRFKFKLLKWLLIPYITLEFIRLVILSVLHIVGMMVLKNSINLGTLIGVTVFGGFGLRKISILLIFNRYLQISFCMLFKCY